MPLLNIPLLETRTQYNWNSSIDINSIIPQINENDIIRLDKGIIYLPIRIARFVYNSELPPYILLTLLATCGHVAPCKTCFDRPHITALLSTSTPELQCALCRARVPLLPLVRDTNSPPPNSHIELTAELLRLLATKHLEGCGSLSVDELLHEDDARGPVTESQMSSIPKLINYNSLSGTHDYLI